MSEVLHIDGITRQFGSLKAVDQLSLQVSRGETISLLGPSGCGKTTTLRIIAGFEKPDSGRIVMEGHDVTAHRPYERNVGLLFQNYALFPHMTVRENIGYGLRNRGWPRKQRESRLHEMLDLVQLSEFGDRYPGNLSGGQQQRVALARALATEPQVVLLDEPLSALDAKLRQELRLELKKILGAVGSTTIIVTHDQEEAMSMADRILVMNEGRVLQEGSADEIYSRPVSRFVAEFVGGSNWVCGSVRTIEGSLARIETNNDFELDVPSRGLHSGQAVEICLRPERMDLVREAPEAAVRNAFQARVQDVSHLGTNISYVVDLAAGGRMNIIEKNRHENSIRIGDDVHVAFQPEDCIVLPSI